MVSNSDQYNSRGSFLCGWTTLVRNRSCSPTSRVSSVRCEVKQREIRFIPCLFHNTCQSKTNRNIGQIEETRSHCQKELKDVKTRTMVVIESFHLDFSACAMDRRIRFAGSGGERVSWVARQRIAVFPWYY